MVESVSILVFGLGFLMISFNSRIYPFRLFMISLDSRRINDRASFPRFCLSISVSRSRVSASNVEKSKLFSTFSFAVKLVVYGKRLAAIICSVKWVFMLCYFYI